MNPFLKFFILICIDIYIFTKFGKIYGFLGLGIILYRFLDMLGIIRSPKIFRGAFPEGIVYLKDYQGKPGDSTGTAGSKIYKFIFQRTRFQRGTAKRKMPLSD